MARNVACQEGREIRHFTTAVFDLVPLDDALVFSPEQSSALVELDGALDRLAAIDPRQARIVELRFFAGLTVEEAAEVMGISPKTVKRDWSVAKAWLHGELKAAYDAGAGEVGAS